MSTRRRRASKLPLARTLAMRNFSPRSIKTVSGTTTNGKRWLVWRVNWWTCLANSFQALRVSPQEELRLWRDGEVRR